MPDHHLLAAFAFRYLLFINTLTFIMMAKDKHAAIRGEWRTPEKKLFKMVWLGGGLGGCLAMRIFRHKTQKLEFVYGFPVITFLSFVMFFFILGLIAKLGDLLALLTRLPQLIG